MAFILFLPRQGTETASAPTFEFSLSYLFYFFPVRGRKRFFNVQAVFFCNSIYFISSPSGDGNILCLTISCDTPDLFYFFLVRGRKHASQGLSLHFCNLFILFLPRQGTETSGRYLPASPLYHLFLPRQGTVIDLLFLMSKINFYFFTFPRKGTG